MNERNYLIFEFVFIWIAVIYFVFGVFLLMIFKTDNLVNVSFLLVIFLIFGVLSIYFRFKRLQFVKEMEEEINKLKAGFNDKNNRP